MELDTEVFDLYRILSKIYVMHTQSIFDVAIAFKADRLVTHYTERQTREAEYF